MKETEFPQMPMKRCRMCGCEKMVMHFSRNAHAPDGLYSYCRACRAVKNKRHRSGNPSPCDPGYQFNGRGR